MPSEAAQSPPTQAKAPRAARPYALERNLVMVVFFALTAVVIVYGAGVIYRDTLFDAEAQPHQQWARCSEGIQALLRAYQRADALTRETPEGVRFNALAPREAQSNALALDADLRGLGRVCRTEGAEAERAWEALYAWRFQNENQRRAERQLLGSGLEEALRYRSPPSRTPTP